MSEEQDWPGRERELHVAWALDERRQTDAILRLWVEERLGKEGADAYLAQLGRLFPYSTL